MHNTLGERMKKNYENRYSINLTRYTPVIIRIDGKAFHTLSNKFCIKGFDQSFLKSMQETALELFKNIGVAKVIYQQSDEISILMTDYDSQKTEAYFDYNVQKISSICASYATVFFNKAFSKYNEKFKNSDSIACFDARCFNIPMHEIANYFIWRQKDWYRNSVSMYARNFFTQKELQKKNIGEVMCMLHNIGRKWDYLSSDIKNGTVIYRDVNDDICMHHNIIFTEEFGRNMFSKYEKPFFSK